MQFLKIYVDIIYIIVGENIIATIKMRKNFCYPLKIVFFKYCDSTIGLFSIAPHLVIDLPTL